MINRKKHQQNIKVNNHLDDQTLTKAKGGQFFNTTRLDILLYYYVKHGGIDNVY